MKIIIKVFCSLVFILSLISLYFYQQHDVIVKEANIPGWNFDAQHYKIKQIRLISKERITPSFESLEENFLRKVLINTPPSLQPYASRILSLYNPMYKKLDNNKWQLEILGASIGNTYRDLPSFLIRTDNGYTYTTGGGSQKSNTASNLIFFKTEDKNGIDPHSRYYEIEYMLDNEKVNFRIYQNDFKTNYYNFFTRIPYTYNKIDPEVTVTKLISKHREGQSISDYFINSNAKNAFIKETKWMKENPKFYIFTPFSSYFGKYQSYDNVFTATITYDYDLKDNTQDTQQVFYLVEENGKWKVIDVDPLDVVGTPLLNSFAEISEVSLKDFKKMYLIDAEEITLNPSTNEKVYFIGTPSEQTKDTSNSDIFYNPSYFVYKNLLTNKMEKLKIYFHTESPGIELFTESLTIKYADIDGDKIPEILYSYVIPYPEPTAWNPSVLKLDKSTGQFMLLNIPAYSIAKWSVEDIDKDGSYELRVQLNDDPSGNASNNPLLRALKLKGNKLIEMDTNIK